MESDWDNVAQCGYFTIQSEPRSISLLTILESNVALNSIAQIFKQELPLYQFQLYTLKYVIRPFLNYLHDCMWFCFQMQ